MKIVFAASEMVPYAKTGGLADVIGSLTAALRHQGVEVSVFIPRYKSVDIKKWNLQLAVDDISIQVGATKEKGKIYSAPGPNGITVYFVDHPEFYSRDQFYGTSQGDYSDNDRRFIFFQRAVLEGLKALPLKPDVVHCHDWQTGLIPVYLKSLYAADSFFQKTKSIFTIHNLAYQGNFPPDSLPTTGLGWEHFRMERLEYYGKVSFLKGGLIDADAVTTVSERYSQEIQTKEFGCGMEGVLSKDRTHLSGIVNGIDYDEWNPEKDTDLPAQYSADTLQRKAVTKNFLQKENNLKIDPRAPLIGVVTRLVEQKGIDIMIPALGPLLEQGAQLALLGTGEEKYHHILRDLAKKYKGRASVHILFDSKMAKHIYAGSDIMLVPSYYEPCGLAQMIALRFGTVPVVRLTGGLADTVSEYDPKTGQGNGFVFKEYTAEALIKATERAITLYQNEKKWQELMRNGMACDFSWDASAKKYVKLYEMTAKRKPMSLGK
jgi:starch synthase